MNTTVEAISLVNLAIAFLPVVAVLIIFYKWSLDTRACLSFISASVATENAPIKARGVQFSYLNKRRATPSGAFSATTRRAGTLFSPTCVGNNLCRMATSRHFRLVG